MGLLNSSNNDVMEAAVDEVATNSYGMIYLQEDWEKIKEIYVEDESTGGLISDATLSRKDIQEHLDLLAESENSPIKKVRDSVYYMDLISLGRKNEEGLDTITDDIIEIFDSKAIIDQQSLAEDFELSMEDAEFFIGKLINKDYLKEIKAGVNSYYVIGDFLTENYDISSLMDQLIGRSANGTIDQSELSRVISVEAEKDVINYLETKKEIILDLGGEFLILNENCKNAFADERAKEIQESIDSTLSNKGDIVPVEEFEGIVEEKLESRSISQYPDALAKAETLNIRDELFRKTIDYLETALGLEKKQGLYVRSEFEDTVASKAKDAVEAAEQEGPTSDEDWKEIAMAKLDKQNITSSPGVINYFDEKAEIEIEQLIDSKMGGGN